jgi:hypothetical protein
MQPGSLFGFGLVFVLVAWTLSLVLMLAVRAARRGLRRLGPAIERRAVELAAAVPVIVGLAVVAVLIVRSAVGVDHCHVHHHEAHLCLMHGGPWFDRAWVVVLVAVAAAIAVIQLAALAVTTARRRRAVSRLRSVSRHADGIWWVDAPHPVCFVAGFRQPEMFISTGAWDALDDDERAAMLAHERAHVRHGDVARRFVLDLFLLVGAPLAAVLRNAWDSATERLCDARAAAGAGGGESVASAMVKVSRLGVRATPSSTTFTPTARALTDRIEALLADQPAGDRAAHTLLALVTTATIAIVLVAAIQSASLHDVLESLLG